MFDFDVIRETVWGQSLRPIGEGNFEKEPFSQWWDSHSQTLGHLHPQLVEQWVYRHWTHSRFDFIPLFNLDWELVEMSGEEIIERVTRIYSIELNPEFDFKQLSRAAKDFGYATAKELDKGTWVYPLITLKTPTGFKSSGAEYPSKNLALVEGHQRHRYLNALSYRGTLPSGPHKVFQISSPVVT